MFVFIKKVFFTAMTFFNFSGLSVNSLKCISMKIQAFKVREEVINVNTNNPVFYPFSVKVNKCSGNCNNISDPYAKLYLPNVVKNINLKVFNLMSWSNQTKQIKWHESCKHHCRLNSIVCNNKQKWNEDKCKCECKELVDKQECNRGFIWNPSDCNCECNKSYNLSQYLDYKNCKCRKKAAYSLAEECDKNTDKNEVIHNETLSIKEYNKSANSDPCKPYVSLSIFFNVSITISDTFVYFYLNSRPKNYKLIITN